MTDQEPYTRVPNALLDHMDELGNAELRVLLAVVRKTAGYQKACDVISVSQIADMTGLTSRNAQGAVTALLERGLISREVAGKQKYCYRLTISPRDTVDNHIPSDTISPRDTEPYPLGIRLDQKPYPLGITQKKDSKEKKESIAAASNDTPPRAKKTRAPKTEPASPPEVREAIAKGSAIDLRTGLKADVMQVNDAGRRLWRDMRQPDQTVDSFVLDIRYVGKWVRQTQHPYKDSEQRIPPAALIKFWPAAMEARDKKRAPAHVNGHQNGAAHQQPRDTRTPAERAADVAALARAVAEQHSGGGR